MQSKPNRKNYTNVVFLVAILIHTHAGCFLWGKLSKEHEGSLCEADKKFHEENIMKLNPSLLQAVRWTELARGHSPSQTAGQGSKPRDAH